MFNTNHVKCAQSGQKLFLILIALLVSLFAVTACGQSEQVEEAEVIEEPAAAAQEEPLIEEEAPAADEPVAAAQEDPMLDEEEPAAAEEEAMAEAEQETMTGEAEATTTEEPATQATQMMAEEADILASNLLDYGVINPEGEDLGEIEDLMIGLESSAVKYAVLSFGGFLDIGDKLFAIPLNAFDLSAEEETLTLDVSQERLENAPGFDQNNWPDTANPDWDVDLRGFWEPGEPAVRATVLLGYNVMNPAQEGLGEIEDLLIGLDTGLVKYAVVATGGFLDLGEDFHAIPLDAMELNVGLGSFILDVSEEALENAPGFDEDNWPEVANPRWDVETSDFWASEIVTTAGRPAVPAGRGVTFKASDLIGGNAVSVEDEDLGQIEDVLISLRDRFDYAIISGPTAAEEELWAIPLNTLLLSDVEGTFLVNVDPIALENMPILAGTGWYDLTDLTWEQELSAYWENEAGLIPPATAAEIDEAAPVVPAYIRVSEMMDNSIMDPAGETVGQIEDFIILSNTVQPDFAVLSFEEMEGIEQNQRFAIPVIRFDFSNVQEDALVLDVSPETLEDAPSFTAGNWPEFSDPLWVNDYFDYWRVGIGATPMVPPVGPAPALVMEQFPVRATELIGDDLINGAGEDLGKVDDIILGVQERIDYVLVSSNGGLFDFDEETRFVLPMSVLRPSIEQEAFGADIDENTVQTAPLFTTDEWAEIDDLAWDDEYFEFWESVGFIDAEAIQQSAELTDSIPAFIRVSEMLDEDVLNPAGEDLGDVEDLVLEANPEEADFVVLAIETFADFDDELFAIPLESLNFSPAAAEELFTINLDEAILQEAPGFPVEAWPDLTDPLWDDEIIGYWDAYAVAGAAGG